MQAVPGLVFAVFGMASSIACTAARGTRPESAPLGQQPVSTPPAARISTGTVRTDGARLSYTVVPAISPATHSRTIVVLHGGPGATHAYLRPEWDRLAAFGRVVYYDQRGCGASTRTGPYSWQAHVQDLSSVLDRLAPGERVVLAGSSWGALLALAFAHNEAVARGTQSRVAALVLTGLGNWPGRAGITAAQLDSLPDVLRYGNPAIDTVPVERRAPVTSPLPTPNAEAGGVGRSVTLCLGAAPSPRNFATMPSIEALRAIAVPTLVIAGSDTAHLPPPLRSQGETIVRTLPHAQRVVVQRAGHDPWFEQPNEFFVTVRRFLAPASHGGDTR